jgi:transcriptional regulator with XRE-family HTH domain
MNERQQIGNRLRLARTNAKLTQEQLAEKAGLSVRAFQRYESGANSMKVAHLLRISDAVGVTVGWLCGDEAENAGGRAPFAGVEDIVAQFNIDQFRFYSKHMEAVAQSILENYP